MSLRVSVFTVAWLLFTPAFQCLDMAIQADDDVTVAEDQELPIPVSSDMELPPPLPKPEIVSALHANGVVDAESRRTRMPAPNVKVWVGAKLSSGRPQIVSIVADSPAAQAGMAIGDVVDSVNYRHVTSTSDVVNVLKQTQPGDTADFIVVRRAIRQLHRVKLRPLPSK